jgi:hypothetical protein
MRHLPLKPLPCLYNLHRISVPAIELHNVTRDRESFA